MTVSFPALSDSRLALLGEVLAYHHPPEIQAGGVLVDRRRIPVVGGVVRYRQDDGYNQSFALQWNRFKTTQIDAISGSRDTLRRFQETTWRLDELAGKRVLEAGCGPGRFTNLMATAKARLVSFDYSAAIDANFENHSAFENVVFLQADIFEMPFRDGVFDYVFCHGVLQHTPDPKVAFQALVRKLAPGGRISIDVYRKDGKIRPWKSKYLWRWLTTRVKPEVLLQFLEWFIPKWLPLDTAIKRIPYLGNYLGSIIPCWNYDSRDLSAELKVTWAVMDTFDALAPAFDNPATLFEVRQWMADAELVDVDVRPGGNGVVANGRKPVR